jgi:hypothetical protein
MGRVMGLMSGVAGCVAEMAGGILAGSGWNRVSGWWARRGRSHLQVTLGFLFKIFNNVNLYQPLTRLAIHPGTTQQDLKRNIVHI